jgi:hypothetical protein
VLEDLKALEQVVHIARLRRRIRVMMRRVRPALMTDWRRLCYEIQNKSCAAVRNINEVLVVRDCAFDCWHLRPRRLPEAPASLHIEHTGRKHEVVRRLFDPEERDEVWPIAWRESQPLTRRRGKQRKRVDREFEKPRGLAGWRIRAFDRKNSREEFDFRDTRLFRIAQKFDEIEAGVWTRSIRLEPLNDFADPSDQRERTNDTAIENSRPALKHWRMPLDDAGDRHGDRLEGHLRLEKLLEKKVNPLDRVLWKQQLRENRECENIFFARKTSFRWRRRRKSCGSEGIRRSLDHLTSRL